MAGSKRGDGKQRPGVKAAVALGYEKGQDAAPKVIATGKGELAENLIRIAREHGVPIQEDHPLAAALVKLELGEQIPPELYAAVAEVLAFLWRLEAQKSSGTGGEAP